MIKSQEVGIKKPASLCFLLFVEEKKAERPRDVSRLSVEAGEQ